MRCSLASRAGWGGGGGEWVVLHRIEATLSEKNPKVGMFARMLTVLNNGMIVPPIKIPIKDCWYKMEHPKFQP